MATTTSLVLLALPLRGCGLYINKDLKSRERKVLNVKVEENDCELETFWIEIVLGKQPNRLIGVIYRHPTKKNDLKTTEILKSTWVQNIKKENKKTLLTGDFNFDLLIHDKNEAISSFLNMPLQNNFQPCIAEPTIIIDGNKPSLIDNIFSNSLEHTLSENLFERISDHMPNFVIIENAKYTKKNKNVRRRNMKLFDPIKFQHDLHNSILLAVETLQDTEDAFTFFHKKYLSALLCSTTNSRHTVT